MSRMSATTMSLSEVVSEAQRLPLDAQVELAETLLRGLRLVLRGRRPEIVEAELRPLAGMGEAELRVLAHAILAPDYQEELSDLLRKNREGELTKKEERRLDALLADTDQVALLKARALYTLGLYEKAEEPGQ